jgi:3-deoxy-D-arabino-heptulosonate 7-phosphate (DAHP) synthase
MQVKSSAAAAGANAKPFMAEIKAKHRKAISSSTQTLTQQKFEHSSSIPPGHAKALAVRTCNSAK